MSMLQLIVNESTRKLSNRISNQVFVVNDANVDTIRFSIPAGFSDIDIDENASFRVMYIPPGIDKTVYAKTLTFVQNDGVYISYDWQVGPNVLVESGILTVSFCILKTGSEVQEWHTIPYTIPVSNTIHTDDSDEADETITPTVAQRVAVLETIIQRVASGAPIVISSVSAMTDTSRIYVLTTDGKWYYYNGSAWVAGGEYGALAIDVTLTQQGMPADAKTVGDGLRELSDDVLEVEREPLPTANLNRTPYTSQTVSNLSMTVYPDNSISLSGAPAATIRCPDTSSDNRWRLPAGTYTLSGAVSAWICVNLVLFESRDSTSVAAEYSCGTYDGRPVTFTTEQDYFAVARLIIDSRNDDLTGTIIRPQVEEGTSATEYQSPWGEHAITSRLDPIESDIDRIKTQIISLTEDVEDAATGNVKYNINQSLEAEQKTRARENIGAANAEDVANITDTLEYEEHTSIPANLNVTPYNSQTITNLIITANEDNSVAFTGTKTGSVYWPAATDTSYRWPIAAGTYTLSGGQDSWKIVQVLLYSAQADTSSYATYSCGPNSGAPVTFTVDVDSWAFVRFYLHARQTIPSEGITLRGQVESGTAATAYVSPWPVTTITTRFDAIEEEISIIPGMENDISDLAEGATGLAERITDLEGATELSFARTGEIIQYEPINGKTTSARIDFESVDGFDKISFVHCGENLVDLTVSVIPSTKDGITATYENGYVHVVGTNESTRWNRRAIGYISSYSYYLPKGIYSFGDGLGCAIFNLDGTSAGNVGGSFIRSEGWQAVQWYASVRGGHTVDWYWPLMLVYGDEVPQTYKAFEGERIEISLPNTVYGGWIDIINSVLHVTKGLSGGSLVDITEETYDLDPITLSDITGINTLYSVDGVMSAQGKSLVRPVKTYEEPIADCYLNNYYLENKTEHIKDLLESCYGSGDVFFFITDIHAENNRLKSIPLIRELHKKCRIPRLFCGGDVADGMGTPAKKVIRRMRENYAGEIHYTMGNHEYMGTSENVAAYWYSAGKNEQVGNTKGGYYYVDNAQQKIRYIVLNGYKENAAKTNWAVGYDDDQLSWLSNVALNVDTGWGIILFMHNTWAINWETGQTSGYESRAKNVFDILDNYSGDGEIFGIMGGHMHLDAVKHTDGGIPVVLTTCDKCQPYVSASTGRADFDASIRHINTISEQAFDVVIVDRDNRRFNIVRIGCPAWNLVDDVIDSQEEYAEERIVPFANRL